MVCKLTKAFLTLGVCDRGGLEGITSNVIGFCIRFWIEREFQNLLYNYHGQYDGGQSGKTEDRRLRPQTSREKITSQA